MNRATSEPAMVEKLKVLGMTPRPGDAAAFGTLMKRDQQIWMRVMEQARLAPE